MGSLTGLVVGFTGPIASGKTTLARGLVERHNFIHLRSRNILSRMLEEQEQDITEENLQKIGKKVIQEIGGSGLSALVLSDYSPMENYAYDSIRHVADLDYFRNRFGKRFKLLFIDSPASLREERYLSREGRESTIESYNRRIQHPVEYEVPFMRQEASAVVINISFEQSMEQITELLKAWK